MEDHSLTDARLRQLYERALADRGAGDRERCAPPEEILALVRRAGPEARRLEVLDHVMGCRGCRAEFDLLRSLAQAGAEAERHAPGGAWLRRLARPLAPGGAWLRRFAAPVALAASLVLFVAVGLKLASRGRPDVERGAGDAVTLLAPAAEIDPGAPVTFRWQPVPAALRYQLEVLDEQGGVVFAQSTAQTSATLPDTGRLSPGKSYRWWVRASTGSGEPLASPLRSLRVRMK